MFFHEGDTCGVYLGR